MKLLHVDSCISVNPSQSITFNKQKAINIFFNYGKLEMIPFSSISGNNYINKQNVWKGSQGEGFNGSCQHVLFIMAMCCDILEC